MQVFLFSSVTSYRHLRTIAQRALTSKKTIAFLYAGTNDYIFLIVQAEWASQNIEVIALAQDTASEGGMETDVFSQPALSARALLANVSLPLLGQSREVLYWRREFGSRKRVVRKIFCRLKPSVMFCCEDGVSGDLVAISAAQALKLPVVDVPYGNATKHDFESDLSQKSKKGRIIVPSGLYRFLLECLAPQWIKQGRYVGAVIYPPARILVMESLGITLRDAWIIHGGLSDFLCAENNVGLRQYRREGISEDKLRLTDSSYCDIMVEAMKNTPDAAAAYRQPRKIKKEMTSILISWPPSYHDSFPGKNEFSSYEEMTKTTNAALKSLTDTTLTVSLYPACGSEVRAIFDGLAIPVANDYLLELIVQCAIFTTCNSSTICWAQAAGKVVVNYDAYKFGLTTYDEAPGVVNTTDVASFCKSILHLASSEDVFIELITKQIENADERGIVDGKCSERIFSEVDRLAATRANPWRPS